MGPGTPKKRQKTSTEKTVNTCVKKRDAGYASAAGKVSVGGGGVPPTDLLRRTTMQAKPSKLTRAS